MHKNTPMGNGSEEESVDFDASVYFCPLLLIPGCDGKTMCALLPSRKLPLECDV